MNKKDREAFNYLLAEAIKAKDLEISNQPVAFTKEMQEESKKIKKELQYQRQVLWDAFMQESGDDEIEKTASAFDSLKEAYPTAREAGEALRDLSKEINNAHRKAIIDTLITDEDEPAISYKVLQSELDQYKEAHKGYQMKIRDLEDQRECDNQLIEMLQKECQELRNIIKR